MAHPFRQITVAGHHVGVVVAQLGSEAGSQLPFGQRQPHRLGQTLAQWTGGDLDPDGVARLGMARRERSELPELLQVGQLEALSGQMQHGVEQDRGVAGRQHETIAVGPGRVGRVIAKDPGEQHMGQRGQRHGGALMARSGPIRPIQGQAPNHRDPAPFEILLVVEIGGRRLLGGRGHQPKLARKRAG